VIVIITDEARADLDRIGDFIAEDNPRRAASFVDELLERCRRLADMPRAFPLVPRYEHYGVRRRVHGEFLIFYRIGIEQIDVLHVLNGAQNYEAILFPSA
jgi:plasmid stabilization system protein ParE